MPRNPDRNRRFVLASRPGGEVLPRTAFPSPGPYMRGRMSDLPSCATMA